MSRIELTDSVMDVFVKMADGNPGAISAMMDIHQNAEVIDPQAAMGGLGAILLLDTWEIYGSSIYILWNDKCDRDARKFLLLQRMCQLGFLSTSKLQAMAADQMRKVNLTEQEWSDLEEKVLDQLDQFQRAA